jgi:hypothetical protein
MYGANVDGKLLVMFFPRLSEEAVYFLFDPSNDRIAQCDETGRILASEWMTISPHAFVKTFWNGKDVSLLARIMINGRYLSEFKREYYLSFEHSFLPR